MSIVQLNIKYPLNHSAMKNLSYLSIICIGILMSVNVSASTITVDNKAGSAAQFSNLQTAVDAAAIGDTILVAGSSTSYGNVTVTKQLALIGQGGLAGLTAQLGNLNLQNATSSSGASGSLITGFRMSFIYLNTTYPNIAAAATLSDITIERCNLNYLYFSSAGNSFTDTYSNFIVRNNVINQYIYTGQDVANTVFTNMEYSNNIFNGAYYYSYVSVGISNGVEFINSFISNSGVSIKNNLFIGSGSQCFYQVIGALVENNIFFGRDLIAAAEYSSPDSLQYDLTFNNNLVYLTAQDLTLNDWFAIGSNNLTVDPQFINFPTTGAAFSSSHDYHLGVSSPALGAGVSGEDLGIYGGLYPWSPNLVAGPRGPKMTEVKAIGSPSVPVGGTIEIQFKSVIEN